MLKNTYLNNPQQVSNLQNENIALIGGAKSKGLFNQPNQSKHFFHIYNPKNQFLVGSIDVSFSTNEQDFLKPISIVNLIILPDYQKQGLGSHTVYLIRSLNPYKDIKILDVKKDAIPFWNKLNAIHIPSDNPEKTFNLIIPKLNGSF